MDSPMNKIKDIMERYNLCFRPRWKEEDIEPIDLFYVMFLFSAVLFCAVTFFLPAEHEVFIFLSRIATAILLVFVVAIIVCVVIFYKEVFNFKR